MRAKPSLWNEEQNQKVVERESKTWLCTAIRRRQGCSAKMTQSLVAFRKGLSVLLVTVEKPMRQKEKRGMHAKPRMKSR